MNNLTVDNNASLNAQNRKHRKSVIGKLERSSFQAQRLSDVGIAFSQQITAKVGLKLPASQERIVEQTRWLYLRYVFVKLRQNKLPLRDLNLTKSSRARRAAALGASNEAQIIVSISEPPSADALTLSDQRPLFTPSSRFNDAGNSSQEPSPRPSPRLLNHRKRSALTTCIESHNLSLLAARVRTSAANNNNNYNNNNNNNNHNANGGNKRHALKHQPECIDEDSPHEADEGRQDELAAAAAASKSEYLSAFGSRLANVALSSARRLSYLAVATTAAAATANTGLHAKLNVEEERSDTFLIGRAPSAGSSLAPVPSARKFIMDPTINNQIFSVIMNMINELRESKPEIYGDTIYEVIGLDKFSSLESLLEVQKTICQEMTRLEISWERITALFSLFGAMSLDCVRLGAPEHVGPILDGFIGFVERDLALWISQQGGWESFLYKFRAGYHYGPIYKATALSLPLLICWALLATYS